MIPDNESIREYYEREEERWDRLRRRMEIEEEKEDESEDER